MFERLLSGLMAPAPTPVSDHDARLALAALLVRIARADGDYSDPEVSRIDRILAIRYELSPEDGSDLRSRAEALEAEAPDTVRFTRAIKDHVGYEDRIGVIEALWTVVLVDGERDYEENALLRMIAPLLGVSDRDSGLARQRVQKSQ